MRRRRILLLALFFASLFASSAFAGIYMPDQYCVPGTNGESSYSSSWYRNTFYMDGFGPWPYKTVTFIDNQTYGWHATVQDNHQETYTTWSSTEVKAAYCKDDGNGPAGNGACSVYTS